MKKKPNRREDLEKLRYRKNHITQKLYHEPQYIMYRIEIDKFTY